MTQEQRFCITGLFVIVLVLTLFVRYLYKKVKSLKGDVESLRQQTKELKKRLENAESVLQIVQENKP